MIYFNSIQENLQNIAVLAKAADPQFVPTTILKLKQAFNNYLEHHQPTALLKGFDSERINRISSPQLKIILATAFREQSNLNDLQQQNFIDLRADPSLDFAELRIEEALIDVRRIDPNLGAMIDLVFNYYFVAKSKFAGGGSTSGGIGILWLSPTKSWLSQDYAEFLVHELTHQLLFVDERRYGHYSKYEIMHESENFAFSSILNKSRPLDKVVHSLFVAINVLEFRKKYFGWDATPNLHPSSEQIVNSVRKTLDSLEPLAEKMFCPRHFLLVEKAHEMIAEKVTV